MNFFIFSDNLEIIKNLPTRVKMEKHFFQERHLSSILLNELCLLNEVYFKKRPYAPNDDKSAMYGGVIDA